MKPARSRVTVATPKAFRFLYEGEARYRVGYGGRGSAKSWQFARGLLVKAHQRRRRILCTREFQASIRDSVHQLLKTQVQVLGLDGWFKVARDVIAHRNGSEFIFKGLRRDVDEIKSTEGIDICWVEEAQSCSDDSWDVLIPTIRRPGSEIWVTFNPREESDPTYQRFVVNTPPSAIVRKVGWRDNPWLPQVLYEELEYKRRIDPEGFAHIWGGEVWHRSQDQVLDGKWVVQDFEPGEGWDGPYYGVDWGFSVDPLVLTRSWVFERRLYVEYEAHGLLVDNDKIPDLFSAVPGYDEYTLRADNSRPETISHVRGRGLKVVPADKWPGSVEDGVQHLRSYEQIVIHPRCELTQAEARAWRYKTDRLSGDVLRELIDANNNTWDSIRYALAPLIRRRPRPQLLTSSGTRG